MLDNFRNKNPQKHPRKIRENIQEKSAKLIQEITHYPSSVASHHGQQQLGGGKVRGRQAERQTPCGWNEFTYKKSPTHAEKVYLLCLHTQDPNWLRRHRCGPR